MKYRIKYRDCLHEWSELLDDKEEAYGFFESLCQRQFDNHVILEELSDTGCVVLDEALPGPMYGNCDF